MRFTAPLVGFFLQSKENIDKLKAYTDYINVLTHRKIAY
ncbi:protein of unknown function [Maridesulfovibrio hydrothermalis AM13 = DSM 14728]|uniref:Uncharacterized protein n=1 Tax=Maridesulfovibrio hydrothermalis AM13 = DSM 14728 TaxID=1121451 RepID=L0RD76_9BACT|nr:protein of unknown function [Maridesulfovibrio hydrothermalis AM13 = DSM 14728]